MKKIRLEKYDAHLAQELKNPAFRKAYEVERAKVSLAQKIAELRQENKLKQSDLAKRMHVTQQYISQIETAQENNLTLDTLLAIAKALNRCVKISFEKESRQDVCLKVA